MFEFPQIKRQGESGGAFLKTIFRLFSLKLGGFVWEHNYVFFCAGCRFAYITFDSKESLFKALELDGLDYNGRSLRVDTAGDTGGGGGGGGGSGRGGYDGCGGRSGGRGGDRGELSTLHQASEIVFKPGSCSTS